MSKVIQFPKDKLTKADRERRDIAYEFEKIGLDKNESIVVAVLVQQVMKLSKRVKQLEKRSKL